MDSPTGDADPHDQDLIPKVVGKLYKVGSRLGAGSFGVLYEGVDAQSNEPVAIKFESRNASVFQLQEEHRVYELLSGAPGFPAVLYYGQEGPYHVLVLELLGPNLEELFELCGRVFTPKTVAMVGKKMLHLLQVVHERGLLYRDVKPDNFLIGRPGTNTAQELFLIDFGMAKPYMDPETKQHIAFRERNSLSGTARYMSVHTHEGHEQSRRDDLESLGYVLAYFLRGLLPWQGVNATSQAQKYQRIGKIKRTTSIADLCAGFPVEFGIYFHYVRKLKFDEAPDYAFLQALFDKALNRLGTTDDGLYDWLLMNDGKGWQASERRKKPSPLLLTY